MIDIEETKKQLIARVHGLGLKSVNVIERLQRENKLLRHEQLQLTAAYAEDIAVLKQKLEEAAEKALGYASKYDSLAQAITDPENQPSQYGTVPLKQLEEARKDVARLDFFELHPRAVVRSNGYLGSPDSWSWRDEHGATHDAASLRDALDHAVAAHHQHQVNLANKEFEKPSPNRETRAVSCARQQKG